MNTTDKQQELLTIMDSRRAIKSFDPTKRFRMKILSLF